MDRSMDSIGSCSLDVDAESSDISDTSGSLNFPTPISIKDITREFTANIRERCSLQTVKNTTAYVDPVTGQVCIALTQAPTSVNNNIAVESHNNKTSVAAAAKVLSPQTPVDTYDKKPSYLNLACCVNGYSNITTYDSKIRQDINKSREVSPIRPSSSSLQYCKKSNSLAPPVLLAMPNVNLTSPQPTAAPHHHQHHHHHMASNGVMTSIGSKYTIIENNNHHTSSNGDSLHNISVGDDAGGGSVSSAKRSFIQQRVERLYGPGALAQGFYSPKKIRDSPQRLSKSNGHENGMDGGATTELARKFQELSPSKDYNQFRKKLYSNGKPSIPASLSSSAADNINSENNNIDLPCLRHLSQEFRAQLPIVSPKRNFSRSSPGRDQQSTVGSSTSSVTISLETQNYSTSNGTTQRSSIADTTTTTTTTSTTTTINHEHHPHISDYKSQQSCNLSTGGPTLDEVDRQIIVSLDDMQLETPSPPAKSEKKIEPVLLVEQVKQALQNTDTPTNSHITLETASSKAETPVAANSNGSIPPVVVKDAHFFLQQLKMEQNRLLIMAAEGEKYLDALASNPDITEDTLGLLRSATGKARLLVSQKMKQFEGLCHNNLNSSPEDQFPTTVDDLQGFWDMVYLQVDHVDSIFKEIELLKKNEWKRPKDLVLPNAAGNVVRTPKPLKNFSKSRSNTPVANGGGSTASTPSAAALKREAQRKKLQEIKRRNREALLAANASAPDVTDAVVTNIDGVAPIDTAANIQES